MNKVITYYPTQLNGKSVPQFFNEELEKAYTNEKLTTITFIQSDLQENVKDFNLFVSSYKEFLTEWNLPFVFFPYYAYFNKNIPQYLGLPNPKLEIFVKSKNVKINMVVAPAYGFLMLDLQKLKSINFKFNEAYTELYYLQDLSQKCFENKLWISNCCYLDRLDSYKELKVININGYMTNTERYNKEKEEYDKQNIQYHDIQTFLNIFKEHYKL